MWTEGAPGYTSVPRPLPTMKDLSQVSVIEPLLLIYIELSAALLDITLQVFEKAARGMGLVADVAILPRFFAAFDHPRGSQAQLMMYVKTRREPSTESYNRFIDELKRMVPEFPAWQTRYHGLDVDADILEQITHDPAYVEFHRRDHWKKASLIDQQGTLWAWPLVSGMEVKLPIRTILTRSCVNG